MKIAAVMPAKGRAPQTAEAIRRLVKCAGVDMPSWSLIIVVDGDRQLLHYLKLHAYSFAENVSIIPSTTGGAQSIGYWRALAVGIAAAGDPQYVINLANDLLPGAYWLARQLNHPEAAGKHSGVLGFNDGMHTGDHAAHFMAPASLLREWYGEARSPVMYNHMYGDREITERAIAAGKFWINPWSVLYHNHVYLGAATDEVYAQGHALINTDRQTIDRRRSNNWRDTPGSAPRTRPPRLDRRQ